jgi:hypothetical protein
MPGLLTLSPPLAKREKPAVQVVPIEAAGPGPTKPGRLLSHAATEATDAPLAGT